MENVKKNNSEKELLKKGNSGEGNLKKEDYELENFEQ